MKLVKMMQTKGLKIFKIIIWHDGSPCLSHVSWKSWMSWTLLIKMQEDSSILAITNTNFDQLANVHIVLGLACLMPMLWSMHNFMQSAHIYFLYVIIL
jgi:hypothetical protein